MKVNFQKALSFCMTGVRNPETVFSSEPEATCLTRAELDDFETTYEKYVQSQNESHRFSNPLFNIKTDLNTAQGQFRFCGLGVISSLFSGVGAGFFKKTSILPGIFLACLAPFAAILKKAPLLTTKFAIDSFGGNFIRNILHVLDSVFSRTGEKAANYNLPTAAAAALTGVSVVRSLLGSSNESMRLPIDSVSGTYGRTAIHAMDSMFSSKAVELFSKNQSLGTFLASAITTGGFLLPENIRKKSLDYEVAENLITLGSTSFTDSLFSNIGKAFSNIIDSNKKLFFGAVGVFAGFPAIGSLLNKIGYEIPFSTLEGRLGKSVLHAPESFAFNLGNTLGNSVLGIPLSLGFCAFTYLTCLSDKGSKFFKNIIIPDRTLGSQIQRIPFIHFLWSMISACGVKLTSLIPAPLIAALGPALAFQLGEKFKNVSVKFNEIKGLMIRSSVHLFETILLRSAYKTGKMLTGTSEADSTSGSLLSGYWLTDEGRMVPNMAIGKQIKEEKDTNCLNIFLSGISGGLFTGGIYLVSKLFRKEINQEPVLRPVKYLVTQQIEIRKEIKWQFSQHQLIEA